MAAGLGLIVPRPPADRATGGLLRILGGAGMGAETRSPEPVRATMNDRQQYRAGMSAYQAGRHAEAIEHLTPLASGGSGAERPLSRFYLGQAHYRLGVDCFKKGQFLEASGHFQAASQANPSGGGFARFLAVCYLGTGRWDLAARELDVLLRDDPEDAGTCIRLALVEWKQGRLVEAVATLREGLHRHPDNAELHYELGVMAASDDDLVEAERLFEKTVALDPSHAGAYERLGQCCGMAGRQEAALRYLERAHQIDPSNARVALQLSLLAPWAAGRGQTIRIERQPPVSSSQLDEAAIDRLGDAVVAEPDFIEAFLALPPSKVDEEVFSTLATTLDRALCKHPEFADLHYHCGEVYRRLGKDGDAIAHAERAVQINPSYVKALILLARLYGQTDRRAAAVDRLEQARRAGADYPDVHHLLGQLYQEGNQPDRARQAYQRALDLNQDDQAARAALATLPG